jgi:SWI/SNF-related matrix-associated actin-dependent regulator of chromatin subfamily B member 1
VDSFEWDINNQENSPEQFAYTLTRDMGLTPEFENAIAFQIREQIQLFERSLFILDHPFDDSYIDDDDLATSFLFPVSNAVLPKPRDSGEPYLLIGRDHEIEKVDKDRERDARYYFIKILRGNCFNNTFNT